MADPLTDLLARADGPDPLIDADAAAGWPPGAVDRLVALGLLADAPAAAAARCDACGLDHVEEVRWVDGPAPDRRAVIACPDVGVVRVPAAALRRWAVRPAALAGAVAAAVGAAGAVAERVPGRAWKLGTVRAAGRAWPALLLTGLTRPDGAAVAARLPEARPGAVVFVPGPIPPAVVWGAVGGPAVVPLADLLALGPAGPTADRLVLESALTPAGRPVRPPPAAAPAPPGTAWEDVTLVVEDHHVTVRAGAAARRVGFAEAGFEERRARGVPNAGWALLRVLARAGGVLGAADRVATKPGELKQQVSTLRARLRGLVGVEADPFHPTGKGRPYRARFAVRLADGVTHPTPPGTAWGDVGLAEAAPGVVEVSVDAPTTAAVPAVESGSGPPAGWVAVSTSAERHARYTLAELGLAGPDGTPTAAGAALVAVLRGGGRVGRPPGDAGLRALGPVLTRVFGLPGLPLAYRPASGVWVAAFAAGSAVPDR